MAVKNEHPQERTSRLRREEADARVKRWETLTPLSIAILLVLCVAFVTLLGNFSLEERKWAVQVLTTLLAGLGLKRLGERS